MKKPSDGDQQWQQLHEKIIGLGERSIRKSYYPELQQKIRELEQQIAQREQRERELERNYENRAVLNELLALSLQELPAGEVCRIAAEKLHNLSWLVENSVAIFLYDDKTSTFVRAASIGWEACLSEPCQVVTPGRCLCGLAVANGEVQFASNLDERHAIRSPQQPSHGHYCIPIMLGEQPLGLINLYLPADYPYDAREKDFFISVANTLAGLIQRYRILEEKQRFEAMLGQAQKIEALGTLSGGIAHDFNNLLAPMLGYAELALRQLEPEGKPARYVEEILKAATRAKALVMQILTLSHKAERSLGDLQPIELGPVVEEVLGLTRATIPATIEIEAQLEPVAGRVLVEPTHIHQLVLNLCTNAYHAMRETGGTIRVRLEQLELSAVDSEALSPQLRPGAYLRLRVADSGAGMDRYTLERIFDPYFTTKKQGEGTGLGLSVVNGIVKSYRGHIAVDSEPGRGTTFSVYLPCSEALAEAQQRLHEVALPQGSEQLLVVDDEPQVGRLTSDALEALGYQVDCCTRPSEAIRRFQNAPQRYALVVTDMTMPKLTGLEMVRALRQLRPDLPAILCTGFSELIDESAALQAGFQKYLMKPIALRDLAFAVREVLDSGT